MNYEQKYKEALEKARQFSEHPLQEDSSSIVEYIFPELADSEDERIRKELIQYIKNWKANIQGKAHPYLWSSDMEKCNKLLAWLEKQEGCEYIKKDWLEHIKQSWYKEGFIDGKYSGGTSKEWTINDAATLKEIIDFLENGTAKLQHDLTKYANWLKIQFTPIEKQGNNLVENGYTNNKDIIKYADNYSHEIWHKLMDNFENIKDYHIGCNDVSDIVLNAIIDAYNWFEKRGESIKIKKGKNYLCTKTHKYAGVEWIEGIKYYSPEDYSLVNQGCTCYCPKYSKEEHNNFFKEVEYNGCLEKQGEPIDDNIITRDDEILQAISIGLTDALENFGWSDFGGLPIEEIQEWLEKQGEKKPVWSEEDDGYKLVALSAFLNYYDEENPLRKCLINWLKSLKQRMGG